MTLDRVFRIGKRLLVQRDVLSMTLTFDLLGKGSGTCTAPDDFSAATAIEDGLEIEAQLIALTPSERTAILRVLDDPPDGLAELRGVLLRDHC